MKSSLLLTCVLITFAVTAGCKRQPIESSQQTNPPQDSSSDACPQETVELLYQHFLQNVGWPEIGKHKLSDGDAKRVIWNTQFRRTEAVDLTKFPQDAAPMFSFHNAETTTYWICRSVGRMTIHRSPAVYGPFATDGEPEGPKDYK